MPYRMKKQGEKYCVVNSDTGESKGCSDSRKMALAHMRALYAHEGKGLEEIDDLVLKAAAEFQQKEGEVVEPEDLMVEKYYDEEVAYVPYGTTSYAELDAQREAWKKAREVEEQISLFPRLAYSIMGAEEITDKAAAIQTLAAELADKIRETAAEEDDEDEKSVKLETSTEMLLSKPLVSKKPTAPAKGISKIAQEVVGYLKNIGIVKEDQDDTVMFFKDNEGRLMWLARYSNNFIDDDNPPDIISESSHRRFVDCVEKGVYPYPELWLWHEKDWKLGQAVWCAYDKHDDAGFAIAAGYVDPECEPIALELSQLKSRGVSHGMPLDSIVRDPQDSRVIIEHQTKEISLLPVWGAANKLTSYDIFSKDGMEDDTMIPKEKKEQLIKVWGVSEATLKSLEELNAKTAAKAVESGLENKEAPVAEPEKIETTAETTPTPEETKEKEVKAEQTPEEKSSEVSQDTPITRQEIAEAIAPLFTTLSDAVVKMKEQMDEMATKIAELSSVKEKTLAEQMFSKSPVASLLSLYGNNSAVGAKETEVKDGEVIDGPKETQPPVEPRTGISFIDTMLAAPKK